MGIKNADSVLCYAISMGFFERKWLVKPFENIGI